MFAFGEGETVTVPEGVTEIESLAFDSRTMQEIRIPSSVRDIARDAFRECKGLLRLRLEYAQPENGQSWAVFYFPEFLEDMSHTAPEISIWTASEPTGTACSIS